MDKLSKRLVNFVLNEYSIDLSIFEESYTKKTIHNFLSNMNLVSYESIVDAFRKNHDLIIELYKAFNNNYSVFFREESSFNSLKSSIIMDLYNKKKENNGEIRIWSIGCSKGQEPYSLAIIFEEVKEAFDLDINYRIFASDMSNTALDYAKKGKYNISDLSKVTLGQLNKYFDKTKTGYIVKNTIKEHILFTKHDIVLGKRKYPNESIFGDFDIVMISNVLIYYNPDVQQDIARKVLLSLNNDGYLITSNVEVELIKEFFTKTTIKSKSNIFRKA